MDTNTSTSTSPIDSSIDNLVLGHKVIDYALKLLAWGTAVAVAWSCSTLLMGLVMFIIMAILMFLLTSLLSLILAFKLPVASVESLGAAVGSVTGRFTRIFARKAPVAA